MNTLKLSLVDLMLVFVGTCLAQLLRDNFEIIPSSYAGLTPYLIASLISTAVVVSALRLNRSVWRFSTTDDYLILTAAAALIVGFGVLLTFGFNRLEGTARSIPFLQFLTVLVLMVGARAYARGHYAARRGAAKQFASPEIDLLSFSGAATIIVGVNRLTELYLQAAHEMASDKPQIAGLIGRNGSHTGRLMHRYPILGEPEELPAIIQRLRLHGVEVKRIVVTVPTRMLASAARTALRDLELTSGVDVNYLASTLGLQAATEDEAVDKRPNVAPRETELRLEMPPAERSVLGSRPYWTLKRGIDLAGSWILLVLLMPIIVLAALFVAIDMGWPVIFWQLRPGLGGRAFRVYKFRTMRPAFDSHGTVLPDSQRISATGAFMRRYRLDELPQLINILRGEMSFIGPRPLLPVDQPSGTSARLLVRPGLTGWAQINGGRNLTQDDKVALDIWYVRNAGIGTDARIVWHTFLTVVRGERSNPEAVRQAWDDIAARGSTGRGSLTTQEPEHVEVVDCRTSLAS